MNDRSLLIEYGKCVDVCYIDFSRKFDIVFSPKLQHKINAYGFKGKLYAWLADFLQNRKLFVKIGNSLSNCFLKTSGIAQGTCLGPICLTVYIDNSSDVIKFSKCKLFADDVKISYDFFPCDLIDTFQGNINSIES